MLCRFESLEACCERRRGEQLVQWRVQRGATETQYFLGKLELALGIEPVGSTLSG